MRFISLVPQNIPHLLIAMFFAVVGWSIRSYADESFTSLVARAREIAAAMYPLEPTAEQYSLQQQQARLWENPVITLQGGGMKENGEGGSMWATSLLQPIPLYGRRDIQAAQTKLLGSQATREVRQQQLLFEHQIAIRLYELWAADSEREHSRFRVKILTPIRSHLAQVPALSPLQILEKSVVDLRCQSIEQHKHIAEERVVLKSNEITSLLGVVATSVAPPLPEFPSSTSLQKTLNRIVASSQNPTLLSAQEKTAQAQLRTSLAKTTNRPDVGLAIATQSQLADSTQHGALVGFQMTLPLWNSGVEERGARAAEQRAIQAQSSATDRLVQDRRRLLLSQLQEAYLSMSQLPDELRKAREEQLQQSSDALLKGFGDIKLFLELESEVAALHERYITATLHFAKTWSEFLAFEGIPFEAPQATP